nr:COX15/CtaA family protein [Ornithinimicrobium sp. F0845]
MRRILVANLTLQILIVVTGGLVRLTGSGLGCPTWPLCEGDSLTPVIHEAMTFHPFVEYGNRMLSVLVGVGALATVWAVRRWARRRTPMMALAWTVLGLTLLQGLLGGITVLTRLHPITVMGHFMISMALVALSTALLLRDHQGDERARPTVPLLVRQLAVATGVVLVAVLLLGTIVTGSGPHSGDAEHPARFGFDPRTISWLHADAVMLFVGLVVAMVVATRLLSGAARSRDWWGWVLLISLAQGAIGYTQYLTGLPELLVLAHMLGAAALTVTVTAGVLTLWDREAAPAGGDSATDQPQVTAQPR